MTLALAACSDSPVIVEDTEGPEGGGTDVVATDIDAPDQTPLDTEDRNEVGETVEPDVFADVAPDDAPEITDLDDGADNPDLPDQIEPDDADAEQADDADVEGDVGPPPETFYETAELGIRILGPDARGWGQVLGGAISATGIVMGKPDLIFWETDQGLSGYADGLPFWKSSKIDLIPGDNTITVTAQKGEETVTDTLVISYNPAFLFGTKLRIRPGGLFAGQTSTLVFTLGMGLYMNFEPSTLTLCECTEEGECISDVHTMMDDGQVGTSGDEVGGDAVFSWKKTYTLDEPGKLCFRAHSLVIAGYQQYTAYSPIQCVEVVDHFTQTQCEEIKTLHLNAKNLYDATLADSQDPAASRQAVVDLLAGTDGVDQVGTASGGGYGVWVRYVNGVLGVLNFSPAGLRGGGPAEGSEEYESIEAPIIGDNEIKIDSKRSAVFAPYADEFGTSDEAAFISNVLDNTECPPYIIDGPYNNAQAQLKYLQRQRDYGVIAITSHGDTFFDTLSPEVKQAYGWHHGGSQEVIWTGEDLNCGNLYQGTQTCSGPGGCPAGSECIITQSSGSSISGICVDMKQIDLMRGRIAMGVNRYALLPAHIKYHQGIGYPKSMVYLGACRSLWNGTLAMEYFAAGAKAIAGFTGYVTSAFAYEQGAQLIAAMVEEQKLTGSAMPEYAEDPENPGSKLMIFGASNLNVYDAEIINSSWETGELTGWFKDGDGRVVSKLGITAPVEGKFMSLISTGMGYTIQTGEINQDFCIPEDKVEASFYWKFYSEEFKEWCGSPYQDTFQATLEADIGQITMVDTWVDALCPPGECFNCGSQFVGLFESDVEFDVGGVWNTMWQKSVSNVMALAGQGPVTLRFFSSDAGDSIYDTVILIDTVKFK